MAVNMGCFDCMLWDGNDSMPCVGYYALFRTSTCWAEWKGVKETWKAN